MQRDYKELNEFEPQLLRQDSGEPHELYQSDDEDTQFVKQLHEMSPWNSDR